MIDRRMTCAIAGALLLMATGNSTAEVPDELLSLSLEDLLNTKVESVSRRGQNLMTTPASVYVMDAKEIRRTGATRLQDLLKEIPGVFVADISYDQPSSTIRDIPQPYTGTVLVLLDRVPIQSPNTGGFRFSGFDIDISEIEKIEVIKGPGATVYGANAATGVISIFTKSASDESTTAQLSGGTNDYFAPSASAATRLSENQFVRGWLKYKTHAGYANDGFRGSEVQAYSPLLGKNVSVPNRFDFGEDSIHSFSFGLSHLTHLPSDTELGNRVFYTASRGEQPGLFLEEYPELPGEPTPASVFNVSSLRRLWIASTRLTRNHGDSRQFAALSFRHEVVEAGIGGGVGDKITVAELDLQDHRRIGRRQTIDFGGAARYVTSSINPRDERSWIRSVSSENRDWLYSAFIQDQVTLRKNLVVTAGVKAEVWTLVNNKPHVMPSLKASYQPKSNLALWGGVSHAITTQGHLEASVEVRTAHVPPPWAFLANGVPMDQIPAGAGKWVTLVPATELKATEYWTGELGVRFGISDTWQLDTSAFSSSIEGRTQVQAPDLNVVVPSATREGESVVPIYFANTVDMKTYGGEAVLRYQPSSQRRFEVSYSLLESDTKGQTTGSDSEILKAPQHNLRFNAYEVLPGGIGLKATANWTSDAPSLVTEFNYLEQVRATAAEGGIVLDDRNTNWVVDLLVRKRLGDGIELKAWGKNLLNDPYVEDFPDFDLLLHPHAVERSFGMSVGIER